MTKDVSVAREGLLGHSQGLSLEEIRQVTGVPRTTVKRIIDRIHVTDLSPEQILNLYDEDFAKLVAPPCRSRMRYVEPDWELIYLNHERPRKAIQLRVYCERNCQRAQSQGKVMSYPTFCRAYAIFGLRPYEDAGRPCEKFGLALRIFLDYAPRAPQSDFQQLSGRRLRRTPPVIDFGTSRAPSRSALWPLLTSHGELCSVAPFGTASVSPPQVRTRSFP